MKGCRWLGLLCMCAVGITVSAQHAQLSTPEKGSSEPKISEARYASRKRQEEQQGSPQKETVGGHPGSPKKRGDGAQQTQDSDYEARLSWFTEMLVGVGILQFLILAVQACVFWQTLRQMRDSSQRQLRAYICVTRSRAKIGEEIEGEVRIKNFGQTPAYNVRQWISAWVEAHPLRVVLPEPEPTFQMAKAVLGPGDPLMIRATQNLPAPGGKLGTREATVYIYGRVLYTDAFGKERRTSYRLIFGGPETLPTQIARTEKDFTVLLKPDLEGNEAD